MRDAMGALAVVAVAILFLASRAALAGIEPVGKLSVEAGAEKEEGTSAGGRGSLTALGVMPIVGDFGLQGKANYTGGLGSRFGLTAGPLYSWGSGKVGLFVSYQYRTFNSNNFVHLLPSAAFYLPQVNINLYYSHPISDPQRDGRINVNRRIQYGINELVGSFSYFPGFDIASFMKKDNIELTLGVQGNSFGGAGTHNLQSGVGPVFGLAFMPMKGWEVNVVQGTIDNHGRYKVLSGVSFYFDKIGASLKELRRRYLEPNNKELSGAGNQNGDVIVLGSSPVFDRRSLRGKGARIHLSPR